jgi:hypothetical protein
MATTVDNPGVVARPPLLYGAAFVVVLVLRWFWPMPILGHAVALWSGLTLVLLGVGIAIWGRRTMQAAGTNINPSLPSTLPQSPLCGPDASLFRPHLGRQYVVGHCPVGPASCHHASRSCPVRGALP